MITSRARSRPSQATRSSSGNSWRRPELDRVGWFALDEARGKLVKAQVAFVDRLLEHLG